MANLKNRTHFINILLDKWLNEEKLSNEELGAKVRRWYFQNENRNEHWIIDEGEIPWRSNSDGYPDVGKMRYDNNYGGDEDIYQ